MNWLDWVLLVSLGIGAFRGFRNGFIIEVCSLVGLVLGLWGAAHFSGRVAERLGWEDDHSALAFLITFLAVLVLVGLLGRALTKAIDIALLTLPNKVAGTVLGLLRSAFMLSVLLNCVPSAMGENGIPDAQTCEASTLHGPVRAFAPLIVPELGHRKWVQRTLERVKAESGKLVE